MKRIYSKKLEAQLDDFQEIYGEPGELPQGKAIAVDYQLPNGIAGERVGPFSSYAEAKGWTENDAMSNGRRDTDGYWVIIADESSIEQSPSQHTGNGYVY